MSKSEARSKAEATKRLKINEQEDSKEMVGQLRYESRKSYLAKRKEDKRMELEAQVHDDETIFANEK